MYNFNIKTLGKFDVAVCGGGIAGVCAAVSAARNGAKTVLIESLSSLGGTVTEGIMGNIMDGVGKGGIIKELLEFLEEREMTLSHLGKRIDENGKKIHGRLIDVEIAKYFFEKICLDAGVRILYSSTVCGADHENGHINSILVTTYCGNFEIKADIYIDATGNGNLSDLVNLKWEIGNPPNPASLSVTLGGLPKDYDGTDSPEEKTEYAKMLKDAGFSVTAEQVTIKKNPCLERWSAGYNFEYNIMPDDIERYSDAIIDARKEAVFMTDVHRKIKGCENVYLLETASYFGVREGRRIFGEYRLTLSDIIEGKRFEDGICLVTTGVDLHKSKWIFSQYAENGLRAEMIHTPIIERVKRRIYEDFKVTWVVTPAKLIYPGQPMKKRTHLKNMYSHAVCCMKL